MKIRKYDSNDNEETDYVLGMLIIIGVLLLIYTLSYIVAYYTKNNILLQYPDNIDYKENRTLNPNEIGDSIGGVLNPLIGFTAAILTFLAFYIQFKANNEQRDLYYRNQQKDIENLEDNYKVNLRIFKNLVESMLNHYKSFDVLINKYANAEKETPLFSKHLVRSTDSSYEIFKNLDFKEIYTSVVYNFSESKIEWEKEFIEVLNIIDFYDKLINKIVEDSNNHTNKKVIRINEVGEFLNLQMNDILPDPDLYKLDGIIDYLAIVYNRNPDNTPVIPEDEFKVANVEKLYNTFFPKFINSLMMKYRAAEEDKAKFKKFLDIFNHQYKILGGLKGESINLGKEIEEIHLEYFNDKKLFTKVEDFLNNIRVD